MNKYQDSKTRIYIDASNIILSLREIECEIDFLKLKVYLEDRFRTNNIYYFTPSLEKLKEDLKILEENNFIIIKKEIYYYQNKIKANCDVEISHYMTSHIKDDLASKIVLLSGDGDFSILLEFANKNNIKVMVISADKKSTAKLLRSKKFYRTEYLKDIEEILKKKDDHGNVIHGQCLSIK